MYDEPFGHGGLTFAIAAGGLLLLGVAWTCFIRRRRLNVLQLVIIALQAHVAVLTILFCHGRLAGELGASLLALPAIIVTAAGVLRAAEGASHLARASITIYALVITASLYFAAWSMLRIDWAEVPSSTAHLYLLGSQAIGASAIFIFLNTLGQRNWVPLRAVSWVAMGWSVQLPIMGFSSFFARNALTFPFFGALFISTLATLWFANLESTEVAERTRKSAQNPVLQWSVGASLMFALAGIAFQRWNDHQHWSIQTTQTFVVIILAGVALNIGMIELRSMLRRWQRSERRFESMFQHAPMSLALVSREGTIVEANQATSDLLGWEIEDFLGQSTVGYLDDDLAEREMQLREDLFTEKISSFSTELWVPHKDGSSRLIRSKTVKSNASNPDVAFLATMEDATDRYVAHKRLQHMITHDPITGLANRQHLLDNISLTMDAASDHFPPAVVVLSTRGLQSINDSFGTGSLERIVLELATRLERTVGESGLVGRLDSDRFALLLYPASVSQHLTTARELGAETRRSFAVVGRMDFYLEVGIGLVLCESETEAEVLLGEASAAAQRALTTGSHQPELGQPQDRNNIRLRHELISDLHVAVDHNQFVVMYQPIVSVATGIPQGVEALVRWEHPDRGLLYPDEFLPIAEEAGMMGDIGRLVMDTAVAQVAHWNREIFLPQGHRLCLSLNTGPQQYLNEFFAHEVSGLLDAYGFPSDSLCLEITESMVMSEHPQIEKSLQTIHDLGVRFALDDFGTGYSSMEYLKRFPISEIKIDREFVGGLGQSNQDTAIVKVMIDLSHALNLHVVAEGVETESQRMILGELGADYLQGFLFSRPIVAKEFAEFAQQLFEPAISSNS